MEQERSADEPEGVRAMRAEMARQCADARATLNAVAVAATTAARSLDATQRLALVAMGGSHHVNATVAPLYRARGIEAFALSASDLLAAPLPDAARTILVASQSGRSGEILEWLGRSASPAGRFALTLDGTSPLASACEAALVAAGGPERAFAATRSIILTLAMHGAILEALGDPQGRLRSVLAADGPPSVEGAEEALSGCDTIIFAGYGILAGAAASAALATMELARLPALAFDGGQFRHGPFEMLRPGIGVVLLREAGAGAALVPPLALAAADAGCATVVFDASGENACDHGLTVAVPAEAGLAAAVALLLALQPLAIRLATRRLSHGAGTPLRTSKVTV